MYLGFKEVLSISITILNGTKWINGLDIQRSDKRRKALKSHSAKNKLENKLIYNTTRSELCTQGQNSTTATAGSDYMGFKRIENKKQNAVILSH